MTNTEDFIDITSKKLLDEKVKNIKKYHAQKFLGSLREREIREEKEKEREDKGFSRIIITENPRPPTKEEIMKEYESYAAGKITIPEEPVKAEDLLTAVDLIIEEEDDEIEMLKAKLAELESLKGE